jgi:DNA-binding NarL/FixJ family response regulator
LGWCLAHHGLRTIGGVEHERPNGDAGSDSPVITDGREANSATAERARHHRLAPASRQPAKDERVDDGRHTAARASRSVRIGVGVCDEHEIVRAGLIASLHADRGLMVRTIALEQVADDGVDVAIVSGKAARERLFRCPIVIVSDESEASSNALAGNDVAGVLQRRSLTVSQLLVTVRAAAAGLRIEARSEAGAGAELDPRGLRVLELIADGCTTREIAALMNYSERTIKKLINELEDRLGTRTRAQTVAYAMRRGLL